METPFPLGANSIPTRCKNRVLFPLFSGPTSQVPHHGIRLYLEKYAKDVKPTPSAICAIEMSGLFSKWVARLRRSAIWHSRGAMPLYAFIVERDNSQVDDGMSNFPLRVNNKNPKGK